jgi:hypothetical protein
MLLVMVLVLVLRYASCPVVIQGRGRIILMLMKVH